MFLKTEPLRYLKNVLNDEEWLNFTKKFHCSLKKREGHSPFNIESTSLLKTGTPYCIPAEKNYPEILGVIVESRFHPNLVTVVEEVLEQLNIPVQIFHGPSSTVKLETHFKKAIANERVILTQLVTDKLPPDCYNTLLMSSNFWKSLKTRKKVLIFQCDTALCPTSDFTINDFLHFDYIGSWWPAERPVGVYTEGGNGGLSLRSWQPHYLCTKQIDSTSWEGAEDTFFAFYLSVLGYNVATAEDTPSFGTQHKFVKKSFGLHKISCLSDTEQRQVLEYTPSAKRIIENP